MRYAIVDRSKLTLFGVSCLVDLRDLDMCLEDDEAMKLIQSIWDKAYSQGIRFGMMANNLPANDRMKVLDWEKFKETL